MINLIGGKPFDFTALECDTEKPLRRFGSLFSDGQGHSVQGCCPFVFPVPYSLFPNP